VTVRRGAVKKHRYVAFLRAINVGGRVVKMAALKTIFESLKLAEVETFIASGNVIFRCGAEPARLEPLIEGGLQRALGYPVLTFLRTPEQIAAVAEHDPFGPLPPGGRMYVGFLRERPSRSASRKVDALTTPTDAFALLGRELYWMCATPSLESIISGAVLEKVLGQAMTLRNANTVRRLAAKYPCT
jgi:uncharacterized protein (DUF1697 family)